MKKDIKFLHQEFLKEQEFATKLLLATIGSYKSTFELLIKMIPDLTLKNISPAIITEFFEKLEKRERKVGRGYTKTGVKKSTIATYWGKLNKFFEWLRIKGYIRGNPFNEIKYPSVHYEDMRFLSREEVESILNYIREKSWNNNLLKKRNELIIWVGVFLGLRKNELINIRRVDIDWNNKTLRVNGETSKSKKDRILPVSRSLMLLFRDYFSEVKKRDYKTNYFIVSSNKDNKLTNAGLKHFVSEIKREVLPEFHAHRMRHTFAVNYLKKNRDIYSLKELMGHRDIKQTAKYLRCIPNETNRKDIEMLKINEFI
jgi:integrase